MTLDERLRDVFGETFEIAPDDVRDDMTTDNTEGWDSMRTITLSYSLEQAFGVEFTDAELMSIDSYARVRNLLEAKGVPA